MPGFASKRMMASDPISGHWMPRWNVINNAKVDEETWYQITTRWPDVARWIRTQPGSLWYEHPSQRCHSFDIHEKIYTILLLKWS